MVTIISTESQVEIPGFSLNTIMTETRSKAVFLTISMSFMFQRHLHSVIKYFVNTTNAEYLFIDFSSEAQYWIFENVWGVRVSVIDWIYNACYLAEFPIENVTFISGNSKVEESYNAWYENIGSQLGVPKFAQAKHCQMWDDIVNSSHTDIFDNLDREGNYIKPFAFTYYNGVSRQHRVDLLKRMISKDLFRHGLITMLDDPGDNELHEQGINFPLTLPSDTERTHNNLTTHNEHVNPEFLYSHNWAYLDVVAETIIGRQPDGNRHSFSEAPEWWQSTFYTEKIWRAIYYGRPFMLLGAPGQLAELRSHGYETFNDLWSEEYDTKENLQDRINAITHELEQLAKLDRVELNRIMSKPTVIERLERNRQVFNLQNDRFNSFSWSSTRQFKQLVKDNFDATFIDSNDLRNIAYWIRDNEDQLWKHIEKDWYMESEYSIKLTEMFPEYKGTVMMCRLRDGER